MKRSVMLEILEKAISSQNTGYYFYNSKEHANQVLKKLEDAGMQPPSSLYDLNISTINPLTLWVPQWDKEDETN